MSWRRFVAIGDSLTEGVGDPVPGGGLRGWADRLAHGLAGLRDDFAYVNLAHRGLRTHEIVRDQLPHALELEPDLASAIVGMNDLIRPDFEPAEFRTLLVELVRPLAKAGTTVLTATFPDVSRFMLLPRRMRDPIHHRLESASQIVRDVSLEYDTIMIDGWNMPETRSRKIISIDCMHPNDRGHLLLARAFADVLEKRAGVEITLPDPPSGNILSRGTLMHLRWIATNAAPEIFRLARRVTTGRV